MFHFEKGQSTPLGAMPTDQGVNFAVFSEHAEAIELCLFDEQGQREIQRIKMQRAEGFIWCVFVHALPVGAKYGYRAYGKYDPELGFKFNPNKLLIDPYARCLDSSFQWSEHVYGFNKNKTMQAMCEQDSASFVPKGVVIKRKSTEEIQLVQKSKPKLPWEKTFIYEMHVRGFTRLNASIPEDIRGTFSALAHKNTIAYLKSLGVTAVELLPIHAFIDEAFLVKQGLRNFWGYNTLNFFSPHLGYMNSSSPDEFLSMVSTLHEQGIEVILDVVYNHTAESDAFGPTLSFRGLDNSNYYRSPKDDAGEYINDTGCGNTVKCEHPQVLKLILDSLRYWAGEMGVDGFRFDLASILGRNRHGFQTESAFFQAIAQDPLLSETKLIAEPWDIGPGGYQLGAYPSEWSEWNDKYRDVARRFWRGDKGLLPEFARRIHGSSELFEHNGRGPRASLNFLTSHDGFTLADTVSYRKRHNEANNENNADGHHENYSENYGVEGNTDNKDILALRQRQHRNMLATLVLSQGTPMLLAGDELGRSQQGNNNAYCQDNEINWINWSKLSDSGKPLLAFTKRVIALRQQWQRFFSDTYIHNLEEASAPYQKALWLSPSGQEMQEKDWHSEEQNAFGFLLKDVDKQNEKNVLILFNANTESLRFILPQENSAEKSHAESWQCLLDTNNETGKPNQLHFKKNSHVDMVARSLVVLSLEVEVS